MPHTLQQLEQCNSVNTISVLSHLGMANDANNSMGIDQIEQFHAATHHVSYRKKLANSAALLNYPYSHVDIIPSRVGVVWHQHDATTTEHAFKPRDDVFCAHH